ncbi:MAG: 7-cyano-7-deazaguanine synthase [Phycisphaeraceae bacterium]|nr:7-cyano-7-deazaguanine synthase [Phycisphaeraceae bacterium]
MNDQKCVILSSGGLRSLVATGQWHATHNRPEAILLHVRDGRANDQPYYKCLLEQAQHYRIDDVVVLDLPHLRRRRRASVGAGDGSAGKQAAEPRLIKTQLLLSAIAMAAELGAERLIWPVQSDGQVHAVNHVTEQILLAEQLAELDCNPIPKVETPLLELTDKQVIELGTQLDVPWHLAWACNGIKEQPCKQCLGCQRRAAAFRAAGVTDPIPAKPKLVRSR